MKALKVEPVSACRVVPLTSELLSLAIALERDPLAAEMASHPNVTALALQPDLSFAILDGGALICACGVFKMHYGKAAGWALVTPLAERRHLAFFTRRSAEYYDRWQQDPAFRRIEIHIRADKPWRETFAKRLGMTEGFGPLKAWDAAGRDYWLYARVA